MKINLPLQKLPQFCKNCHWNDIELLKLLFITARVNRDNFKRQSSPCKCLKIKDAWCTYKLCCFLLHCQMYPDPYWAEKGICKGFQNFYYPVLSSQFKCLSALISACWTGLDLVKHHISKSLSKSVDKTAIPINTLKLPRSVYVIAVCLKTKLVY